MLKNYFKIAARNLMKNKIFSIINVVGLAVGLACCILIALYVHQQLNYDRFHARAERIVRVTMQFGTKESLRNVSVTGTRVLPEFGRVFPEVENGVRIFHDDAIVKRENKVFTEDGFAFADSSFFSIFSFKLTEGNPVLALTKPYSVILTRSMAEKYFGSEEAIGKFLRVDNRQDYLITGIMEDCPPDSQIKFKFLASFSSLDISKNETWWDASHFTYLLLRSTSDIPSLQSKITAYMKKVAGETAGVGDGHLTFFLEPFLKVHLYSNVEGGLEPAGDYRYVYIFSGIALLILGIAFANYINLTTARAADRAREVGVRKVMGAIRKQLISQFIGESYILVLLALVFSAGFVQLLLPTFNGLSATELTFGTLLKPVPLVIISILIIILGLLGGGYPALVLSKFKPSTVLKGNYRSSNSGLLLRRILVVFQFMISMSLIVSTLVIQDQLDFIQNRKLGYDTDRIMALPIDDEMRSLMPSLKNEFETNPNILSVTFASRTPVEVNSTSSLKVNNKPLIVNQIRTDKNFIKTLGIQIISGMDFTEADEKAASLDAETGQSVILNEAAIKSLHWSSDEAVGKFIEFRGKQMQVKAVIENFHFASMHREITPLIIFMGDYVTRMIVKLSGNNPQPTLEFMNERWNTLAPDRPFEYEFLDDQFNNLYRAETRTSEIFFTFAILAIGLACLGLLGLIAFMTQQRTKEIGIRKALGASVLSITQLLSKDFLKLVLIAIMLSTPLAWYLMDQWLENFAYRMNINVWVFVLAGGTAIGTALFTVSFQSIKAAIANPVDSLRNE